jgi:ABC-type phosphate transport system auxiliary subunit
MNLAMLGAILVLTATSATAATPSEICRKEMHKRVAQVDAIMRKGYKVKEGERLNALHRELEKIRSNCDREPEGWKSAPRP